MDQVKFPRRLFTEGEEPEYDRSIGYFSKNTELWTKLQLLLTEEEWSELENSKLGVLFKFTKLPFKWASKVVQSLLAMGVACEKKFEIWSVVGVNPLRFSLHEFEHITGLNCEYEAALTKPATAETEEMKVFWQKLGVNTKVGPSIDNLIVACKWAGEWSREDRLRLAYLAVYAGFIDAHKSSTQTRVELASLVMDLDRFENYPWGRVAFKTLIKSVKRADQSKPYVVDGFAEVLQVWAYYAMPKFGETYGDPRPNNPEPPLLAFNGIKGKRYVIENMKKQDVFNHMTMVAREDMYPRWDKDVDDWKVDNILKALYGEFGGRWIWKPSDWASRGLYVVKTVKSGKSDLPAVKKRLHDGDGDDDDDHDALSAKKARTSGYSSAEPSGDGWKGVEVKIEEMLDRFSEQLLAEMKLGFDRCDAKIELLTTEVVAMGNLVEKLRHPVAEEQAKSNDANLKKNQTGGPIEGSESENVSVSGDSSTKEDSECHFVRTHIPTAADDAEEKMKQENQIRAENIVARGRNARTRKLASTQQGDFEGNSTVKRIVPNTPTTPNDDPKASKPEAKVPKAKATPGGYNPFVGAAEEEKRPMLDYVAALPGYPTAKPDKELFPDWAWWSELLTSAEWLVDTHVDAWVRMMNLRLQQHPEWFRSDRICLLDSKLPQFWQRDWPRFQTCQLLPANALDYYYGKKPSYCTTNKRWGVDIDDIYIPLSIRQVHWVALHVSIPKRHIIVYDSLPSTIRAAEINRVVEPYAVMIPYLLNEAALTDEKHLFPRDKFTFDRPTKGVPHQSNGGDCGMFVLKFIECLALGYDTFPGALRQRNVLLMREKTAAELFNEIQCRGPIDGESWEGLDMYDE